MKEITKLTNIFKPILGWNKARVDLLSFFLSGLMKVRSVNLTQIAVAMPGKAKVESKYRRLRRFFASFQFSTDSIAKLIAGLLPIRNEKWDLSMDRTNWKLGKKTSILLCWV